MDPNKLIADTIKKAASKGRSPIAEKILSSRVEETPNIINKLNRLHPEGVTVEGDTLNWGEIVTAVCESRIYTQDMLAFQIGTTQQAVSSWMTGSRKPSAPQKEKLLDILKYADMDVEKYRYTGNPLIALQKYREFSNLPLGVRKLTHKLNDLSVRKRKAILKELNAIVEFYTAK